MRHHRIRSAAAPGRTFPVTVTALDAPRREEYGGPQLGLVWRRMPDLQPSFETFTRGLKQRVESGG